MIYIGFFSTSYLKEWEIGILYWDFESKIVMKYSANHLVVLYYSGQSFSEEIAILLRTTYLGTNLKIAFTQSWQKYVV